MNPYAGSPDSFPGTIPLPDDSDPPKAATFNPAEQGNADRTAALAAGYRTQLADLATLKAIDTTLIPDTATRVVKGYGVYKLDKSVHPTFAEDQPAVVAPTTGTGRWYAQDIALIDYEKTFTANGSWTCPPNIAKVELEIVGGGGGGGGAGGDLGTTSLSLGGGGGAAAKKTIQRYTSHSGNAHTIGVGAGGLGGVAGVGGTSAPDGGDGGTTYIEWASDASKLAQALGGQGGAGGIVTASSTLNQWVWGGRGAAGTPIIGARVITGSNVGDFPSPLRQLDGGVAGNAFAGSSSDGAPSDYGFTGGIAGSRGTAHTHGGGGGGGGGGASEYANGGNGGHGGDGAASGNGVNGANGASPIVANCSAGGGGGGAGGSGSSNGATGGAGGAGAAGFIRIRAVG